MPAINPAIESIEIEAASPQAQDPENETYVVRMRLLGTYEVRRFLNDNGIDDRQVAFAIEELSRMRQVTVNNRW